MEQRGGNDGSRARHAHSHRHESELQRDRILAAILFEATMDRDIKGRPTAEYLWEVKKVVPVLEVDKASRPRRTAHS